MKKKNESRVGKKIYCLIWKDLDLYVWTVLHDLWDKCECHLICQNTDNFWKMLVSVINKKKLKFENI